MVERPRLSVIVHPGDRQDRQVQFGVLLIGWIVGIPMRVEVRVIDPFLKNGRRVAGETVELAVRSAGLDPAAEQPSPEGASPKTLACLVRPLVKLNHACRRRKRVVAHREIDSGTTDDWHDGRQMRWELCAVAH